MYSRAMNVCLTAALIVGAVSVNYAFNNPFSRVKGNSLRTEIEAANNTLEQLYVKEDVNSLMKWYAQRFAFFAEYRPAILDGNTLQNFFDSWFRSTDIKSYRKKIHTLEEYPGHILEIGTFSLNYAPLAQSQATYNGKYMIMWKRDESGKLIIVSEATGSEVYIEPEVVPYANVEVKIPDYTAQQENLDRKLLGELEAFDRELLKVIADGDGDKRAKGFTEDAILMGVFDSIRVGMASIRPKVLNTYKPTSTYIVKHHYSHIIDLGDYIFASGHYKGGPTDPKIGGQFEGKMSNLLLRNKDGKLLMHRQLGNRDNRQN